MSSYDNGTLNVGTLGFPSSGYVLGINATGGVYTTNTTCQYHIDNSTDLPEFTHDGGLLHWYTVCNDGRIFVDSVGDSNHYSSQCIRHDHRRRNQFCDIDVQLDACEWRNECPVLVPGWVS